jgi:hypothetical protein
MRLDGAHRRLLAADVVCMCVYVLCVYECVCVESCTAILIIIEGQFQVFQRFSSGKLALKTVESRFVALNYYENGSKLSPSCLPLRDIHTYIHTYMHRRPLSLSAGPQMLRDSESE